jgi:hypothetical protein
VRQYKLVNPKKVGKTKKNSFGCGGTKYSDSGILRFMEFDIYHEPHFLDYIAGGCQINLVAAIDFTASNMNPQHPESLHHINPNAYNQYQSALFHVGEILLNYDSDKMVPMFGFGAKVNDAVSHCFPMTFDPNNEEVYGIEGMMLAYQNAMSNVEFAGPTFFADIIHKTV